MAKREAGDFSVINFFRLFEAKVKKFNRYPLTSKNLVIQKDAYSRLASSGFDHSAFASLEVSRKEKDTDLRFAVDFLEEGFWLSIEGITSIFFDYKMFKTEGEAASQIFDALTLLANGQVFQVVSLRNGVLCAIELFLDDPKKDNLVAVLTLPNFSKYWRAKSKAAEYDSEILKNAYLSNKFSPSEDLFIFDKLSIEHGRKLKRGDIKPLTKAKFTTFEDKIIAHQMGSNENKVGYRFLLQQWETYLMVAIVVGLGFVADKIGLIPPLFRTAPSLMGLFGLFIFMFMAYSVFGTKENLRAAKPDHRWFKIDRAVGKFSSLAWSLLQPALILLTVSLAFMPNEVAKQSGVSTNLWSLSSAHTIGYLAPALSALGLISFAAKNPLIKLSSFLAFLLGIVDYFFFNFAYTNTDIPAKEPYETISITTLLFAAAYGVFMIYEIRKAKSSGGAGT